MLRNLILLCALNLAFLFNATEALRRSNIQSRPTVLKHISGQTLEDRLYLEGCIQSSVRDSCILAIDGDVNQEAWSNECAVTAAEDKPWWEAQLENPSYVTKVDLFNLEGIESRGMDALMDFEMLAGRHICIRYQAYTSFINKTFACDAYSDYIRIQSNLKHSVLALCEVAVYGKNVRFERNHEEFANGEWPIAGRSCMASSVYTNTKKTYPSWAHRCGMAMDRKYGRNAETGQCARTDSDTVAWWEMELETPALLRKVYLLNRVDCCMDSLNNFEITVDGRICAKFMNGGSFNDITMHCKRFGTSLRVTMSHEKLLAELTLCEVTAYGYPVAFVTKSENKYLGCYKEKKQKRDMEQLAAISRMSKEKCERICRRRQKPFFGLQQGKQCWCSERYGLYGLASEDACWMSCDSNKLDSCGAKLHNSIYEIKDYEAGED